MLSELADKTYPQHRLNMMLGRESAVIKMAIKEAFC